MSVQASSWAIEQVCETPAEKAVLLVIAAYAGADGTCYPGQDTIARQACCSVKTVERVLKTFAARGWLERTERRRRDGSRTSDLLHLCMAPNPERREQPDTMSGSPEPSRHPVQTNPTSCPDQPDTMSGLTTFEPLGEITPPNPPRGGDAARSAEMFETVWNAYPETGKAATNRERSRRAWDAALTDAEPVVVLEGVRRFAASKAARVGGGARVPSLHRWLNERRWEAWATPGDLPSTAARWEGPPELRAAVVAAKGEAFARSWLDPCRFRSPPGPDARPMLLTGSTLARDRLSVLPCLADIAVHAPPPPQSEGAAL